MKTNTIIGIIGVLIAGVAAYFTIRATLYNEEVNPIKKVVPQSKDTTKRIDIGTGNEDNKIDIKVEETAYDQISIGDSNSGNDITLDLK